MLSSVKKVFQALDSAERDGNKIRITYHQISVKSGVPKTAISGALKILKRDGFIDCTNELDASGRMKANAYRILRKMEV